MTKITIFIGTILIATSCSFNPVKLGKNTIQSTDGEIVYYFEKAATKSDTLLLAFQGSDCNSVANDKFIASIRSSFKLFDLIYIEKPGITDELKYDPNPERQDCPPLYLENDNPQKRASDAIAVINRIQSAYQYKNIVVLGGSEGGLIAVMVAAMSSQVSAVVTINGGGAFFIDDVLHNIKATSQPQELKDNISGFKQFTAHILNSEATPMDVSNHGFGWWRVVLEINQADYLKQIQTPVLVIQSDRDESVSPVNTTKMVDKLQKLGHKNIELRSYPELNHSLTDQKGENHLLEVLGESNNWLKQVLSTGS